jgi:hypothetical protein
VGEDKMKTIFISMILIGVVVSAYAGRPPHPCAGLTGCDAVMCGQDRGRDFRFDRIWNAEKNQTNVRSRWGNLHRIVDIRINWGPNGPNRTHNYHVGKIKFENDNLVFIPYTGRRRRTDELTNWPNGTRNGGGISVSRQEFEDYSRRAQARLTERINEINKSREIVVDDRWVNQGGDECIAPIGNNEKFIRALFTDLISRHSLVLTNEN